MEESRVIIELLCRGNREKDLFSEIEGDRLLKSAISNKVLSSLAHVVFSENLGDSLKGTPVYSRLREALVLNERDRSVYLRILRSLIPLFAEKSIPLVLLKGLSLEGPVPRDMGDLDILISPDDLEKSIAILRSAGFEYTGGERGFHKKKGEAGDWQRLLTWSNQFEFLHRSTGLLVELHTNFFERYRVYPFNPDALLDRIDDFRERAVFSPVTGCPVLSPEDRFLLLSIHNSIKRSAPNKLFALRNILDMKNLMESEKIDWKILFFRAGETGTLLFLVYSLEMLGRFFPEAPVSSVLAENPLSLTPVQLLEKKIMHRCFVNLNTSDYFYAFLFRFFLPFAVPGRFAQKLSSILILPVLFAQPWRLRQLYNLPKGSPLFVFTYLFEPLRWIRVGIRTFREKREGGYSL